jgi:hypothetical protein
MAEICSNAILQELTRLGPYFGLGGLSEVLTLGLVLRGGC